MAKTTLENLKLGIFVVVGTILLVIAAYLIGNRQNMFGQTFTISAVFNNANGLQNGNNVRFSGINVGTVKAIDMVNDTTIRVYMLIEKKMMDHIRKDAVATIGSDGLVGSMILNIIPGTGSASLIAEGDELKSYSRIATQDMLSTLNTTNQNAAILTADLLKVTQAMTKGKGTMGRLLNDTLMAADLKLTIENLKNASRDANYTIQKLNSMVDQMNFEKSAVGVLMNDTANGQKMKNVLNNLEQSSIEIGEMTKNLNSVIGELKEGDGAIKFLAKDTLFVNSLENTIKNIEESSIRFNENMEALKHNFLTRRYFRKLEKEKNKEIKSGQ
ncbi:MAG: MCE family protein [Maribacter sp.]|nr:MCE family protein [Maribacter sp.]